MGRISFSAFQKDVEISIAAEFARIRKQKRKKLTLIAYWAKDELKNEQWNLWLVGKDKNKVDWVSLGSNSIEDAKKKLEEIDKKTGNAYQLKKEFELIVEKNAFMKKNKK